MRPSRTFRKSLFDRTFGAVACLAVIAGGVACSANVDTPPTGPSEGAFPAPKPTNKVDLLFVIDNSLSMADKQAELARRIPELIRSLTAPPIDPATGKPRTKAIDDVHVAVISSSLGSHGTSVCDSNKKKSNDDRGHLLPRSTEGGGKGWKIDPGDSAPVVASCPAPVAASALSWSYDPVGQGSPSGGNPGARFTGAPGAADLQLATSCVMQSVKDDGCGYEETLESMYHFLIDPAPYASAKVKCTPGDDGDDSCGNNKITVEGVDDQLLAQRASFLRPDSLVAIVILSDENDFSLKPASVNWLPFGYGTGKMQRGWASCKNVPDDFEPETPADYGRLHGEFGCFSCFEKNSDPNCMVNWSHKALDGDRDGRALRGFQQVQRFGYNFLWSRQRYVDALTKPLLPGRNAGEMVPNPLFAGGKRAPSMVFVATIVGVPEPLVADGTGKTKSLSDADWEKIASSDPKKRDPHMIESIAPRTTFGIPKFAGDVSIDPINGGDRDIDDGDDLQYACIGPRPSMETKDSECTGSAADKKNPVCGKGGTQPRLKAYPGLRHLRFVRALGNNGVVGSICASSYAPVMQALVEKMQPLLIGK